MIQIAPAPQAGSRYSGARLQKLHPSPAHCRGPVRWPLPHQQSAAQRRHPLYPAGPRADGYPGRDEGRKPLWCKAAAGAWRRAGSRSISAIQVPPCACSAAWRFWARAIICSPVRPACRSGPCRRCSTASGAGCAGAPENNNGCPPIVIPGGYPEKRHTTIDCGTSSQFLSALLLAGPCLPEGS
jgi:hypothetical protein